MARKFNRVPKAEIPKVDNQEWEQFKDDAEAAKELLEDPRFKFFRDYLDTAKQSIVDYFVKNRIRPVDQTVPLEQGGQKTLHTTKEEQLDELSGQYKFIEQMLGDLRAVVNAPKEAETAAKKGMLELPTSEEEQSTKEN